jgi:LuxR family transcriptional regulator, maltose regulon positive regulatory protein
MSASPRQAETVRANSLVPVGRPGQIERTRLLAAGAPFRSRPVMTVVAPAGYGKTTFAAQWCHEDDRAVAWLGMSDADNDPVRLVQRIAQAFEELEEVAPGLVEGLTRGSRTDAALAGLIDTMAQRSPVLVVVDDAHRLHRRPALDVLGAVANAMPSGSQLVLASRAEPPIPIARLRVAGDLHEVGAVDLAFDEAETAAVLEQAGVAIADDELAELWAHTEGWPAAVTLVAMTQRDGRLVAPTDRHRHLADYFTEEVLSRESDGLRRFLLETSLTLRISAPLCDAITGRDDAAQRLRELAASNLFVVPLDESREWYRYHHLFQGLLRAELEATVEDLAPLFDRAAAWHEEFGDPAEAFEYATAAHNFGRAGRILLGHWEQYADCGRLETLLLLLNRCREEDIESDSQLAIGAGWVVGHLGDAERTQRYLAAAARGDLDGPAADGSSSLEAALRLLRAAVGPHGASQMLDDGRSLVASELPERTPSLVGAYRSVGVAKLLLGHPDEAVTALDEAVQLSGPNPALSHLAVWSLGHLALAHIDLGQWRRAETFTREAETAMGALDGQIATVPVLAARATIQANAGDRAGTLDDIAKANAAVRTTTAGACLRAHLICRSAEAAHLVGEHELAGDLAIEARSACAHAGDAGVIRERLDRLEFDLVRVDPRVATLTPAEKRVLNQLATHRTQQEIAGRLYVSRATVKTHVQSIYAKLGVSSRDEAVATLQPAPTGAHYAAC